MPHWHEHNPWADRIVYVTLEELAVCCAVGKIRLADNRIVNDTPRRTIATWRAACGNRLDAYVFLRPDDQGYHSCGVRYGPRGHHYLSEYGDPDRVKSLLQSKGYV